MEKGFRQGDFISPVYGLDKTHKTSSGGTQVGRV